MHKLSVKYKSEISLEHSVQVFCAEHVDAAGQVAPCPLHDGVHTFHKHRDLIPVDIPHVVIDILASNLSLRI